MSDNKLVEKTKKVLEKQSELSSVIDELKSEVKEVFFENRRLSDENEKLKKELSQYQPKTTKALWEKETKEDTVSKEEILSEQTQQEVSNETVQSESIEEKQVERKQPVIVVENRNRRQNAIMEFFLGKNIIAKIAAILIFLGVISFGQLAYVEFLNNWGRFFLILFTGALFFGAGVYMEKKEAITFSSVFYIIGLFIIFYSFVLGSIGFELFRTYVLSYILVAMMAGTFYYFRNKRYEFLDIMLFVFYIVLGYSFLFYIKERESVSLYFEATLLVAELSFIMFMYVTKYFSNDSKKDNQKMRVISNIVFAISQIVLIVTILNLNADNSAALYYPIILYLLFGIYYVYLSNIVSKENGESRLSFALPTISTLILVLVSLGTMDFMFNAFNLQNPSLFFIVLFFVFTPLYGYLYLKQREEKTSINTFYIIVIAVTLLLYSLSGGALNSTGLYPYYILNLTLCIEVLLFYVLSKFTKEKSHQVIAYVFTAFLLARNLGFYFADSSLTFRDSNVLFVTLGTGVLLLTTNLLFRYVRKEEDQYDNVLINGFNLLALIPFAIILTNDLISTDNAYIMAMVMTFLIAYRWLMELDPFRMFFKKHFVLGINIGILLLTFFLNLIYFDHDFSQFNDVFKFLFLFAVNVYIINSLKEIYVGYCKTFYVERNFIILYGIGVLIHSFFIHNYINFEFDKVILSSYFLIASAIGVLAGFRQGWSITRKIGLGAIYYSLAKFFIYDFLQQDFSTFVRMVTYFILGFILLGISFLYAYLEKTYGIPEEKEAD